MKKCNNKHHNTLAFQILVASYDKFDSEMIYCGESSTRQNIHLQLRLWQRQRDSLAGICGCSSFGCSFPTVAGTTFQAGLLLDVALLSFLNMNLQFSSRTSPVSLYSTCIPQQIPLSKLKGKEFCYLQLRIQLITLAISQYIT